jgi:PilZ domain
MALTKSTGPGRSSTGAQRIASEQAESARQKLDAMGRERRRSPRVELLGLVSGRLLQPGTPIVVRDMSLGGLSTETPFPLERGSVHDLQLTLGDGAAVDLRARVMHCRNIAAEGETPNYFTGFQFVDEEEMLDNAG